MVSRSMGEGRYSLGIVFFIHVCFGHKEDNGPVLNLWDKATLIHGCMRQTQEPCNAVLLFPCEIIKTFLNYAF